jgi:hypothetical protein
MPLLSADNSSNFQIIWWLYLCRLLLFLRAFLRHQQLIELSNRLWILISLDAIPVSNIHSPDVMRSRLGHGWRFRWLFMPWKSRSKIGLNELLKQKTKRYEIKWSLHLLWQKCGSSKSFLNWLNNPKSFNHISLFDLEPFTSHQNRQSRQNLRFQWLSLVHIIRFQV